MVEVNFFYPSEFQAVFTNLNATGRYGPTTLGSHYTGQDHDGQVTLSSGIQQWTVPYTGDYRIEAIGAAGGYDPTANRYIWWRYICSERSQCTFDYSWRRGRFTKC